MHYLSLFWKQVHSKRLRLGGALILAGAFSCLHLVSISALFSSYNIVDDHAADHPAKNNAAPLHQTAQDIVHETFKATFSHLQQCSKNATMRNCALATYKKRGDIDFPWWYQSMLRDASNNGGLFGYWHNQSAPNILENGEGIRMCAVEKIGIKQWKDVFCKLNNNATYHRADCLPEQELPDTVPKFVFLRDPLERFLSAFIDKCLRSTSPQRESHYEPVQVFEKDENGLTKGLLESDKLFFEAYVNTMPPKWNLHFFPQSFYCEGLFRHLPTYDFVGMMDRNFYDDLNRLGMRYGDRMMSALEDVFHFQQARNQSKRNEGVKTSA